MHKTGIEKINPSPSISESELAYLSRNPSLSQFLGPSTYKPTSNNSSLINQPIQPTVVRQNRQQTSHANLFAPFKEEKPKEEPIIGFQSETLNLTQKYNKQSLEYDKYHFDDRIRLIIRRMSIKAYICYRDKQQHPFMKFPIQKMLSILAKKLFLNRFELLFLEYVLEEIKWKYQIDLIARKKHQFISYMSFPESEEAKGFKQLEIFLLYAGYYSKKSLNELPSQNMYNEFLKSCCQNFKDNFQQWSQNSGVLNIKISPKSLNNIFKRLTFYSDRDLQEIQNYCLLVEEIIDISPAYNNDKTNNKPRKNKKRKVQHVEEHQQHLPQQSEQIPGIRQQQMEFDHLSEIPPLGNKKKTSYMSLVDGMDHATYLNRDWNA